MNEYEFIVEERLGRLCRYRVLAQDRHEAHKKAEAGETVSEETITSEEIHMREVVSFESEIKTDPLGEGQ